MTKRETAGTLHAQEPEGYEGDAIAALMPVTESKASSGQAPERMA